MSRRATAAFEEVARLLGTPAPRTPDPPGGRLFGRGRPLFDVLPTRIELEIVRVIDTPEATHVRYRVRR